MKPVAPKGDPNNNLQGGDEVKHPPLAKHEPYDLQNKPTSAVE